MTTSTGVTEQMYLHSTLEGNPEFVHGRMVERAMPTYSHAAWQLAIASCFLLHAKEWGVRSATELHVQTGAGWRVPDVTILDRKNPIEQRVVEHRPVAVFEVLSPDDRLHDLCEKLSEYTALGIPQIWVVDPADGLFKRYIDDKLVPAVRFTYSSIDFAFDEIVSLLDI
jgi:Uma2 family endonuclease